MRIIDLALKDIVQILKDKGTLLFLLVMPIAFTIFMGFIFKPSSTTVDTRIDIGWVNKDAQGVVSRELETLLEADGNFNLESAQPGQENTLEEKVRKGDLALLIVIPQDYSSKILQGEQVNLSLVAEENTNTGQSAVQAFQSILAQTLGGVQAARLSAVEIQKNRNLTAAETQDEINSAFLALTQKWAADTQAGVQVVVEKVGAQSEQKDSLNGNSFNQTSPGMLLQFAIFGLVSSAQVLVHERKNRTLQRLLTTSMSKAQIIAGHLLAMFLVTLVQQAILILFGQFFLQVNYFNNPLGTLLIAMGLSFWVAGMGLFIGVLAKGDEQVVLFSMIAMFLFTSLGGAWFPLDSTGAAFAAVGRLTPGSYAMTGYQDIVVRGLGIQSILLPAAGLFAVAILFFGLAIWRFRVD